MALLHAVVPVNPFLRLNPAALRSFLDQFLSLGVPAQVNKLIVYLLEGNVASAENILQGG
jgi:hypothetical protein